MIAYLVHTPIRSKIGFTSQTPTKRFQTYVTHNPQAVWVVHREIQSQKIETRLREFFRSEGYINVEGHVDWFEGIIPRNYFLQALDQIDGKDYGSHFVSSENFIYQKIQQLLGNDICLPSLIYDYQEGGGEWMAHLEIEVIQTEGSQKCKITDEKTKMLIHLFGDLDQEVYDFLSSVTEAQVPSLGNSDRCVRDLLTAPIKI